MEAAGKFLGLTAAQFWEQTPREWRALWNVYLDSEERRDKRFGMLYTMYYNSHRPENAPPRRVEELFPGRRSARVPAPRNGSSGSTVLRSPEEQLAFAMDFTKAWRG